MTDQESRNRYKSPMPRVQKGAKDPTDTEMIIKYCMYNFMSYKLKNTSEMEKSP